MPFTPFLGLSILIHLIIIASAKISGKKVKTLNPDAYYTKWSGYAVMAVMFLFVITNATLLVRASVLDRHSVFHYIENDIQSKKSAQTVVLTAQTLPPAPEPTNPYSVAQVNVQRILMSSYCQDQFTERAAGYDYSLLEYMTKKGMPHTTADRQALAQSFGLDEYTGKAAENTRLLQLLFIKNRELPNNSCQVQLPSQEI